MHMANLIAFVNTFLSYFLLFGFIVLLCLVAVFVGIKMRKNKDLKENNIPSVYLTRLERLNTINKVHRGIYVLKDVVEDELYINSLVYNDLVYTNRTALYLNELTNRQLNEIDVAFPFGRNTTYYGFKSFISRKEHVYRTGISEVTTPSGNVVKCYDKERCICNLFLYDIYDEEEKAYAILEYKRRYLNLEKLYEYAKILGCYEQVMNIFEVIIRD